VIAIKGKVMRTKDVRSAIVVGVCGLASVIPAAASAAPAHHSIVGGSGPRHHRGVARHTPATALDEV
jgi:hypothetical protein